MPLVTGDPLDKNGLVQASPTADPVVPITNIEVASLDYKPVFVDTRWTPRTSLLTHIEGASWIVDYYSQVLTQDSNLSGQNYTTNPVYQQYNLINGLELKVSTPLVTTQNETTKSMELKGSAVLYPFMIANEGDMFVADIGEGKLGIFRITESIKKSIFREPCYEISYVLNTDDSLLIDDLKQKVVKTLYFHKDFLEYGQNPLLLESSRDVLISLNKAYYTLLTQYLKKFLSNEFKTLLVPGQPVSTYDHFVVDYILSQFTTSDSPSIQFIRKLNVDDDENMKCDNIWTAMKYKDISYLNTCFKRAGLTSTSQFTNDPVLEGIRYTGISNVVYPIDPQLTIDNTIVDEGKELLIDTLTPSVITPGSSTIVKALNLRNSADTVAGYIYPVTKDDYYVLSADFYNNTNTKSTLEGIVYNYLTDKEIDPTQLLDTSKAYFVWAPLEQYYYVPIILTLIRSFLRGL